MLRVQICLLYYRQYEKEIRQFLQDLVLKTSKRITDSNFSDIILEIWDKTENYDQQILDANTEGEDNEDTLPLFTIDTQPTLKSNIDVPTYGKVHFMKFVIIYISV